MSQAAEIDAQGKSMNDLGSEALWFFLHIAIAIATVLLMLLLGGIAGARSESSTPKLVGTVLAFLLPLVAGFAVAKWKHNGTARYVWVAGLLIFAIACVWVIDLPTGPGLCEHCVSLPERLRRTFFSIDEGSGLMGGQGLLIGCWIPLSLFGYALGAKFGLD